MMYCVLPSVLLLLRAGIEPATRGFSVHCSTTELSQQNKKIFIVYLDINKKDFVN